MLRDPTDQVVILRDHLEEWEALMQRVHGHLVALDLADGYRDGKVDPQFTKLTRMASQTCNRMKGYLDADATEEAI